MLVFLYNILVFALLPLLIPYLAIAQMGQKRYSVGFWERLGFLTGSKSDAGRDASSAPKQGSKSRCIWIHAVSVGEVIAAIPLVKGLRSRFPTCRIVFSTFTPSAREVVEKRCPGVERVFYFPWDTSPIIERMIDRIDPSLFLLVETDIWPVFLRSLKRRRIPSIFVNGRISSRRLRARPFFRQVLGQMTYLCIQSEYDLKRLLRIGIHPDKARVTGNMKFEEAVMKDRDPTSLRQDLCLPKGALLLVAGSTHKGEELEVIKCYQRLREKQKDWLLLMVPRHPSRVEKVEALFQTHGISCIRRSRMQGPSGDSVIILDTIGELSAAYALGTIVFVGGSFVRRGGHNLLEPAAWGKPVFFGPHMDNHSAIASMIQTDGGGLQVNDGEDLATQIDALMRDEGRMMEMGRKAASFVARNQGAVERNLEVIERVMADGRPDLKFCA